VIGKFNGHLEDVVLFIADEAYWGGDKRCVGRLQGMITEPELPIQHKGFNTKGPELSSRSDARRFGDDNTSLLSDMKLPTAAQRECSTNFEGLN
jgi:hypothetical protein